MKLIAQNFDQVFGTVSPPPQISKYTQGSGATGLNSFLSVIINLAYAAAGITFIFMVIMGAFQWITSGGEKEAIAKARARITQAIIGLVLLATTGLILSVFGGVVGFHFFSPGAPLSSSDPCQRVVGQSPNCP